MIYSVPTVVISGVRAKETLSGVDAALRERFGFHVSGFVVKDGETHVSIEDDQGKTQSTPEIADFVAGHFGGIAKVSSVNQGSVGAQYLPDLEPLGS